PLSTQTYSVPAVAGATAYTWTAPSDATISDGGPASNPLTTASPNVSVTFGCTAGQVTVTASRTCGTSAPSVLSVTTTLLGPRANQTACLGATSTFTAAPAGTGPFTYQWRKGTTALTNGTKYAGVTTGTLSVLDAGPADAGTDY